MQEELLQKISNQLTEFKGETEKHFKEIDDKFKGVDNQFKEMREETTAEFMNVENRIAKMNMDLIAMQIKVDKIDRIDRAVMLMEHEYAKKIDIALDGYAANVELLTQVKQGIEEISNHLKRHDIRIGSMELKA